MNRKPNTLAAFLVLALVLLLTACSAGGDKVERFAEAAPNSGEKSNSKMIKSRITVN